MFFTRIPIKNKIEYNEKALDDSIIFLPIIGWIVGLISALAFYFLSFIFPIGFCIILATVATILTTGAFHEDGFADFCDGFGGGWTKSKILEIMKDSRIGTYGVVGLLFIIISKIYILTLFKVETIPFIMIAAHSLSRLSPITIIYFNDYVRENEDSKAKPLSKKISSNAFLISIALALLPLILFKTYFIFLIIIPIAIAIFFFSKYINKWIGGYTGDCLGAIQQISEITFYISFYILWKYI